MGDRTIGERVLDLEQRLAEQDVMIRGAVQKITEIYRWQRNPKKISEEAARKRVLKELREKGIEVS